MNLNRNRVLHRPSVGRLRLAIRLGGALALALWVVAIARPCAAQVERLPSVVDPVMSRLETPAVATSADLEAVETTVWENAIDWDGPTIDLTQCNAEDIYYHSLYDQSYSLHILPEGLIYRSYLAGVKEPRFAAHVLSLKGDSTVWEGNLGARVSLFRWGSGDPLHPRGIEIQAEGLAQVRLDIPDDVDVRSVDFRGGCLVAWGDAYRQSKFGYYHMSSHLGDEFLLKNPGFSRLNYAHDVLVLGHSVYPLQNLRLYGEVGWAFYTDIAGKWEFQFGLEYAPMYATGIRGAPFFALNAHLRQEVNFGGNFVAQAGWAWRSDVSSPLLRVGAMYYNGESSQYSFYDDYEEAIGLGLWYDF